MLNQVSLVVNECWTQRARSHQFAVLLKHVIPQSAQLTELTFTQRALLFISTQMRLQMENVQVHRVATLTTQRRAILIALPDVIINQMRLDRLNIISAFLAKQAHKRLDIFVGQLFPHNSQGIFTQRSASLQMTNILRLSLQRNVANKTHVTRDEQLLLPMSQASVQVKFPLRRKPFVTLSTLQRAVRSFSFVVVVTFVNVRREMPFVPKPRIAKVTSEQFGGRVVFKITRVYGLFLQYSGFVQIPIVSYTGHV